MSASLETLVGCDERLAESGRPRIFAPGSWWHGQAKAFYTGTAREWWARVGRGGIKSGVIYRLAENETCFGDWKIPPGERHWAVIKSKSKEEAAKGLGIIAAELTALGVKFASAGDTIELVDAPRGIRVVAASVGASSGWRSFFDACDELAKWPTEGSTAVDAVEVIASGRAMTVTHPLARRVYFSSAFVCKGPHYDRIEAGSTKSAFVSVAATWEANPSVTEAQTHELEPDERIWKREYASIPQATALGCFDLEDIDAAFLPREIAQ